MLGMKKQKQQWVWLGLMVVIALALAGCERPDPAVEVVGTNVTVTPATTADGSGNGNGTGGGDAPASPLPATATPRPLPTYVGAPTPDPPHPGSDGDGNATVTHYVGAGETLGYIAQLYGSSVAELQETNDLPDANVLQAGQALQIPQQAAQVGPAFKIIPDSELVYGPAAAGFDVVAWAASWGGYLTQYRQEVEGQTLTGPEIVSLVAHRYSVNPRLLLAVLEYRAGWVTETTVNAPEFALGHVAPNAGGLYEQLGWAANQLNWGYYGRSEGGLTSFLVGETQRVAFAPTLNHGSAGVQILMAAGDGVTYNAWLRDVGPEGLFAAYRRLFGNPFAYTVDPLWPAELSQPALQLPWAAAETWYYTSGPHGGWASGSAWAALDFAPNAEQMGCVPSDAWVRAMSDGVVARSGFGAVVVDLDGDGYAGAGWAVTYMHLATADRVPAGTPVQAGDRLGHPSCEGGFSSGTHVHVARTYNGRWVSADGPIPFQMGGWTAQGLGREYDGLLVRGGVSKEACACRDESNAIPGQ